LLKTMMGFFMAHWVYILQSLKDNRYYIGETSDVEKRLSFHNEGKQRSTRKRIPFKIIYTEEYTSRVQALKRERQIKSWKGGLQFKKLINGM
jgi:putative endonuclease